MKTIIKYGFLLAVFAVSQNTVAQNRNVEAKELPQAAQAYITKHFGSETISSAREDKEVFGTDYTVVLSNGTEIEFDSKGNWEEVDGKNKAVPATILPKGISEYVTANYKNQHITQIDKKRAGYDIELSNGTELEFDSNGKFLRIDD